MLEPPGLIKVVEGAVIRNVGVTTYVPFLNAQRLKDSKTQMLRDLTFRTTAC